MSNYCYEDLNGERSEHRWDVAADRTGFAREVGCFGRFRSASLMSGRNGVDGRRTATEWSAVISLAFCGACGMVSGGAGGTEPAE